MKKALVLLAGLGLSVNAMAADGSAVAFVSGDAVDSATGCSLLGETVQMNLSSNVLAAYGCNITDSIIGVATCHTAGKKGNMDIYAISDHDSDPSTPMVKADVATQAFGGKAFVGSTAGGSIEVLATETCLASGGAVTTEATFISQL